jgi:hypothetical protein
MTIGRLSLLPILASLSLPHPLIAASFILLWVALQRIQEVEIGPGSVRIRFLGGREKER